MSKVSGPCQEKWSFRQRGKVEAGKKPWGGIIVSEKPHLMAALSLGDRPRTGREDRPRVGLGLPPAPQDTRSSHNHIYRSLSLKIPEFSTVREGC